MNKRTYWMLALLFSSSSFGQIGSLEGQRLTSENESELFYTSISYAIARQGQRSVDETALVKGFADTGAYIYSLSSKLDLVKTRKDGRLVEGHWELTRWPDEYLEEKVIRSYENGYYPGLDNTDMHIADSEKLLDLTGCRGKTPLRYGDVTGDGQSEVVVFVAEQVATDFRVFSTTKNEVIFSTKLNLTDSMHKDSVPDYYNRKPSHQYISRRAVVAGKNPSAAKRAYAKLYIDDFNGNEEPDLLLWRKYYESLDLEAEEEGFELKKEKLIHYQFVDGEYQTQDTEEAVIKEWFEENELTWQKGYPSKSECEGEEGELIPEMHDPLLNDSDVLQ